ncbi:hypothetical protein M408DRAFT_140026 [Serendipita vermifera MAFF 305830]|uniref:non-specific serine/threonine protein kinase n=1 Tax=Serendipita vermifera MAFF 305830 TaxID=933852 RepID=A0A0C3B864_SERVB|nr:hypothetical protein M408DRAFT_140026 [Serendipita vermifera MAFF 305830]
MASRPTTPNPGPVVNQQLTNYQLGDSLGKGAFAQVFRALNWTTGETVAIKQIQLDNIPKGDLGEIMAEIDLLKNLNHPNIVKYKGFVKTKEFLNIILEYCENGSLQNICKRFGKFPESLVAVYISQVLHGLVYLHDQGVIHRDIKGANILTNKDGCVKLADFGVSTTQVSDSAVVGSPYWMAPEVIEQQGATTASDIWSVGCVVVELLEGKPPYHFLDPMPALFRIVQDDCPPIPDGASPIVKDFLYHCFQKDCNLRISAKKLLRHPWMVAAKKQMEKSAAPSSNGEPTDQRTEGRPNSNYNYDQAVQRVQQWNEALKSPTKPAAPKHARVRSPSPTPAPVRTSNDFTGTLTFKLGSPPARSRSSSAGMASGLPFIPLLPPSALGNPAPAVARPVVVPEVEEPTDNWDDDFEDDITLTKLQLLERVPPPVPEVQTKLIMPSVTTSAPPGAPTPGVFSRKTTPKKAATADAPGGGSGTPDADEVNSRTIRPTPTQSPTTSTKRLPLIFKPPVPSEPVPPLPAIFSPKEGQANVTSSPKSKVEEKPKILAMGTAEDDYDDLGDEEDDLFGKVESFKLKAGPRKGLIFPGDIKTVGLSASPTRLSPQPLTAPLPSARRSSHSDLPSPAVSLSRRSSNSLFPGPITPPSTISRGSSSETTLQRLQNQAEFSQYEDEDYDVFRDKVPASGSGQNGPTLQLSMRLSNKSWIAGDDDSDDEDPFADFEEPFVEEDYETNLLRDKHARLTAQMNQLIDDLTPNSADPTLRKACDQIVDILEETPDMQAQLVSAHGMLAILEVLESKPSRDVIIRLLEIINLLVNADLGVLESFCLIGGIPVLMGFTSKKYSSECRLEASKTIRLLCHTSVLTLQMFISCRGLRVLVDILDEDYIDQSELVGHALNGIGSVFELQSPTPKNEFCRMFIREGLLDPLSSALINVISAKDGLDVSEMKIRIIQIIQVFAYVSQSDAYVRNAVGTRKVVRRLLRGCELLEPEYLVMLLKAIRNLSMIPSLLDGLQNANIIEVLVTILAKQTSGPYSTEISNHVIFICHKLCRLNKGRQEEAAQAGILPCLKRVINTTVRQFALPILCDLASAGKSCRTLLWQHDGMSLYLDLLSDPYYQVSALEAILSWLQDDTARVEDVLSEPSSLESIIRCFVTAKANSFENILDPLLKIVRSSPAVALGIAKPEFFQRLTDRLSHHKAVVRLNLLRLLKAVCDVHPDHGSLVARFGLYEVVERLSRQDIAVLVRELAREIVPILLPGGGSSSLPFRPGFDRKNSDRVTDMHSLDEITKSRRVLPMVDVPTFPPRTKARRSASEATNPNQPLGSSTRGSVLSGLPSPLSGESGTAKKLRPIQRRSIREAGPMLDTNGAPIPSLRSAGSGYHSTSSSHSESKLTPRRVRSTTADQQAPE